MTLAQLIYRLYLKSPGWKLTRKLRKRDRCRVKKCKITRPLHLHHKSYRWHNKHKILRWILPNLSDPMETLCGYHHEMRHR